MLNFDGRGAHESVHVQWPQHSMSSYWIQNRSYQQRDKTVKKTTDKINDSITDMEYNITLANNRIIDKEPDKEALS